MKRLLLVEDDQLLAETLRERLEKEGYAVEWVDRAQQAEKRLGEEDFHLVLLDLGLPDGHGFDLAKCLKEIPRQSQTPFLFLTAMNSAEHRLQGYELGAEEFIPKPFHLREVLIRVKHVLDNHLKPQVWAEDDLELHWDAFEVRSLRDGQWRREVLQPRDAKLLRLLVDRSPSVVSRDEILNRVWGEEVFPSTRTVDNSMVRLRQALGEPQAGRLKSVRGVGYQFEARPETGPSDTSHSGTSGSSKGESK
jgi:two-component system alkaline phosphatase synthesis response regulator PhoP